METKRKSEKLIFLGFVVLVISFICMIFYFQIQTNKLSKKNEEIKRKTVALKLKEDELQKRENELKKVYSLVSSDNKITADSISKQTEKQIKSDRQKIVAESGIKNVIYIQVGSNETKSNLIDQNFIAILNSKEIYNVINAYDVEKGADNSIRYFNEEDKNLAEQLKKDIQQAFSINLNVLFVRGYKVREGQIEVWIK